MHLSKTSSFFLRLPIAITLLGHGLVRLPKLATFSDWMVQQMENSILPNFLVVPYSYLLPIAEAIVGLLLLIGYQMRITLYASIVVVASLMIGSSSVENWGAIQSQLLHGFYLAFVLWVYESQQDK